MAMERMNEDIRKTIKAAGLKQWQVAKELGISEATIIRWLRDELNEERRNAIFSAIESLQKRKEK